MLHGSVSERTVPGSELETETAAVGSVMESQFQKYRFWKRNGICDSNLETLNTNIGNVKNRKH